MTAPRLNELTATEVAHRLARGETTARAVIEACLEQVARREAEVMAFTHLAAEGARAAADALDRHGATLPMAGAGLGVKDIIDTADMPTGYGSPIHEGHQPAADAACVALARRSGAIVLGKTVTTEFANIHPGPTRNPHDPTRTPGGSSSGSAAAVAAMMLPLALGTQTTSSTIRPASFCGVLGFVPSLGEIPLSGVRTAAQSFDRIGIFARSVADIALAFDVLRGLPVAAAPQPLAPRIGYCRGHLAERMDAGTAERLDRLALHLSQAGADVSDVTVGTTFLQLSQTHQAISSFEFLRNFTYEIEHHWARISATLREGRIAHGRACSHSEYRAALQQAMQARAEIASLFAGRDVLLAAAAAGEAPQGSATGDFQFCAVWTVLGLPALSLPLMTGPNGLPIGAQLLAKPGDEARLLAAAEWVMRNGIG
ncbi:amidase [Falsiroseomonas sp. E2-1-a20]|uniref:amidase n=1 Tax=Falsiroseomonas sp. E2-1-a20 TaxID=3239300 RepID=UPI003F358749